MQICNVSSGRHPHRSTDKDAAASKVTRRWRQKEAKLETAVVQADQNVRGPDRAGSGGGVSNDVAVRAVEAVSGEL